jgi:hypothetical protein
MPYYDDTLDTTMLSTTVAFIKMIVGCTTTETSMLVTLQKMIADRKLEKQDKRFCLMKMGCYMQP